MTVVRTKTPSGEAIVILPESEFERLRSLAEDALDARAIGASQDSLRAGAEELLTEADLDALRAAPSPLAFWRARRGAAIEDVARECGVPAATIAGLERGEITAATDLYAQLARVLDVEVEDLAPSAG